MDFSWTESQAALRRSVVEFAQKELQDDVIAGDRAARFPLEHWRRCAAFGILGLCVPESFGGSGLDILSAVYALEGLGYGCRDNGLLFGLNAQMWAVQAPVARFGSGEQQETYLPRLVSGEWIGAHGMSEPASGSDSFALTTRAVKDGDGYVLNGTKTFVSNAPVADVILVFATLDPNRGFMGITAFLIDKGTPGLSVGNPIGKMGLRTSPMSEVVLDECRVPASARLGREGNGGTIFKHSMAWERCCILATNLGAMERQLERTIDHANTRHQFGKPIGSFQAVSERIVAMKLRLESARLLLYRAAWLMANERSAEAEVALAKLHLSEAFVQSSLDAVQVHGGYGYTVEYELEREFRDAVGGRLYSGTSEIQKNIVARSLGLR